MATLRNLRSLPLLTLAALLGGCGGAAASAPAPQPAPEPAPPAPEVPETGPFLWEVTGPAAAAPSYLFGTVHIGVSSGELPDPVWEALRAADVFVMEADVRAVDPLQMMRLGMLPEGESLKEMLGEERWNTLVAALPNVPARALDRFQPWMVTTMLTIDTSDPRMLDMELLQFAEGSGKELVFLESAEEQLTMLAGTANLEDLIELLADVESARADMRALLDSYRAGDLDAVTARVIDPEELAEDPDALEDILFRRNRAWIPTLVPLLERGNAFVAVGLGHYPGDQGVLDLLQREGFTVRRVGLGTPALVPPRPIPESQPEAPESQPEVSSSSGAAHAHLPRVPGAALRPL
jgi:uncharacterized protein